MNDMTTAAAPGLDPATVVRILRDLFDRHVAANDAIPSGAAPLARIVESSLEEFENELRRAAGQAVAPRRRHRARAEQPAGESGEQLG